MELKQDCVRDLLMTVEKELGLFAECSAEDFKALPLMEKYSLDDILYTMVIMIEANYLDGIVGRTVLWNTVFVTSLTYKGHELLNNIKDDGVWADTKKAVGSTLAGASISVISNLAQKFAEIKLGLK